MLAANRRGDFVVPGGCCPHGHVSCGSHALRVADRAESSVPGLRQGNALTANLRSSDRLAQVNHFSLLQNNPSNKITASSAVTKSHIKKFTFCCLALSLMVSPAASHLPPWVVGSLETTSWRRFQPENPGFPRMPFRIVILEVSYLY